MIYTQFDTGKLVTEADLKPGCLVQTRSITGRLESQVVYVLGRARVPFDKKGNGTSLRPEYDVGDLVFQRVARFDNWEEMAFDLMKLKDIGQDGAYFRIGGIRTAGGLGDWVRKFKHGEPRLKSKLHVGGIVLQSENLDALSLRAREYLVGQQEVKIRTPSGEEVSIADLTVVVDNPIRKIEIVS